MTWLLCWLALNLGFVLGAAWAARRRTVNVYMVSLPPRLENVEPRPLQEWLDDAAIEVRFRN